MAADLGMSANESTWTINAYAITLASFMLAAGKVRASRSRAAEASPPR